MTAVVYDQKIDHETVGSRRAGTATSVGSTQALANVSHCLDVNA